MIGCVATAYKSSARQLVASLFEFRSEILNSVTDVLAMLENVVGNVLIFCQRRRIIKFQDKLKHGLVELVNDCNSLRIFEDLMNQAHKRVSVMLKVIFGLCFYNVITVPPILSMVLLESQKIWGF